MNEDGYFDGLAPVDWFLLDRSDDPVVDSTATDEEEKKEDE